VNLKYCGIKKIVCTLATDESKNEMTNNIRNLFVNSGIISLLQQICIRKNVIARTTVSL